jgi:RNA polymerase sigma-70 factor, ECF subfamily
VTERWELNDEQWSVVEPVLRPPRRLSDNFPLTVEPFAVLGPICMWRLGVTEDRELWKKICEGDAPAFNRLYQEDAPRLCAFLRRMTGNSQAAEDIVQETFTDFWKNPGSYNPDQGSLRAWLFGISRKRAANWWRKRDPAEPQADEPVSACRLEISSILGDALARLPEQQRLLLWLREVEGQSYEELAAILEIPVGTVRSRLFTARETLRRIWYQGTPEKEVSHEVR